MEKVIYFVEDPQKEGVVRFVRDFKRRGWFMKDKIDYTLNIAEGNRFHTYTEDDFDIVERRIKKDFPNAEVKMDKIDVFRMINSLKRFWVVCHSENNKLTYYSDYDREKKPTYTEDLSDVRMIFAESSAKELVRTIQAVTRDRVYIQQVYLTLYNELLAPVLMITCTSKRSGETKYFTRIEDATNRIRMCNTSYSARKFNYEDAISTFEYLRTKNKNFLYAVMPAFKDNVNCKNLEDYMTANKISRMVVLDLKLKFINRTKAKPKDEET